MKWTHAMACLLLLFACGANGTTIRINTLLYHHDTVGTTAQDAIISTSVDSRVFGWTICHDGGSANAYLAVSENADPDSDGQRVAPGECFVCYGCGSRSLKSANVKGSAAATGYSVVQYKQ